MQASPTVIGLAGKAGVGKTITAKTIAPITNQIYTEFNSDSMRSAAWDHTFLAHPLYGLSTIRYNTEGSEVLSRMSHQIHQQLFQLFNPGGLPSYKRMVELVEAIVDHPLAPRGEKPRAFLQDVGTWCRELNENCFTQYMRYHIMELHRNYMREVKESEDENLYMSSDWRVFVSDVRYPNEANMINQFEKGLVIKLECEEHTRLDRLRQRDGKELSPHEAQHSSENSLILIPEGDFHAILDTTDMTVQQQAEEVKSIIDRFVEDR